MVLKCEYCGKEFDTNARLYMHKQALHKTPSVLLVKHNDDHTHPIPSVLKRKREELDDNGSHKIKRKHLIDDQLDDGLRVIDEVDDDDDDQLDSGLKIIDEVADDDELDSDLEILDEYSNDGDGPADKTSRPKIHPTLTKPNYKALYEKCIKNYRRLRLKCKIQLNKLNKKRKQELRQKVEKMLEKHKQDIAALKRTHERRMNDLEQLKDIACDDRIRNIQTKHQSDIDKLNAGYAASIADLEAECEAKIKNLNDHIKNLQEDEEDFSNLSRAIFNCTTMEEIFEIQRLIKNHQIDIVVQRHFKTLQNLFLSLSYGIIPICDAQRKEITRSQRQLIDKINNSSTTTAKREIQAGRNEIVNLFTIINDSLKLVRNTFNRYVTPGVSI